MPMTRESKARKLERALEVQRRMSLRYPEALCALDYKDPFSLTIAVLLSAQTTDVNVNKVTPVLFSKWPTVEDLASADLAEVEEVVHPLGFYRMKAKHCIQCAQMVLTQFGGQVPADMDALQTLPGVGRKTANIVLNEGFGIVEGIAVDTHVFRIAHRLGFSKADTPGKTEEDLLALFPQELWKPINHQWVLFGREVCEARNPRCQVCELADICPSSDQGGKEGKQSR